jgi:hypothetical protein
MLRELYSLSHHINATLPPSGYGVLVAHVVVDITSLTSIYPLLRTDEKGKSFLGESRILPDIIRSSDAADRPLPIADKGKFILGIGKNGSTYHANYMALLQECSDITQDQTVKAVLETIKSLTAERVRVDCTPWLDQKQGKDPLEDARFIFLCDGQLVTDRLSIKEFWAHKFFAINSSKQKKEKKQSKRTKKSVDLETLKEPVIGKCCITGDDLILVSATLPVMIKGVPGSQDKGAAVMSFNIESAESRKWKDSEHAPMGFDVAERSHQMLNKLLRENRHRYRQGKKAFVYWGDYDTGLNPAIWDEPEDLWDDDAATVAQMIFTAPDDPKGFNTEACRSTQFYLAILTGCDGRVAISRWDEITPAKIAENVTRYIATQKSLAGYKARPIWQLAGSCFRDPAKEHIDPVVQALVMNALWGTAIPRTVVVKAIERIYLDLFSDPKDAKYHARYYARFQILALYTNGMTDTQSPEMIRRLQIAQSLGAIAYLMHDAEITARNLDDPGKTGVAGSLRALSSIPKNVFGRLYQNAILYHLPTPCNDGNPEKQESRRRRLKRAGKLLREEFSKLVEVGLSPETDLPTTFNLDESAWFYLGWGLREATFWAGVETDTSDNSNLKSKQQLTTKE